MKMYNRDGYIRINKTKAKKLYDAGETIYLCPCKLRPGPPWNPECAIAKHDYSADDVQYFMAYSKEFNDVVREYEHFNCQCGAGEYAAYFVREDKIREDKK